MGCSGTRSLRAAAAHAVLAVSKLSSRNSNYVTIIMNPCSSIYIYTVK